MILWPSCVITTCATYGWDWGVGRGVMFVHSCTINPSQVPPFFFFFDDEASKLTIGTVEHDLYQLEVCRNQFSNFFNIIGLTIKGF